MLNPTLEDCLFGAVKLTRSADFDKCKPSGYGTGFEGYETFLFPNGEYGRNIITSGVHMSSSVHVDNSKHINYLWLSSTFHYFDSTLENCLFGAVKSTGNADTDKYKYSGYGTGFEGYGTF